MSAAGLFDPAAVLRAKHAQHVVLVHFPIALYLAGVAFDLAGAWRHRPALAAVAYYNLQAAAWSTLPSLATGALAWQLQLEGQRPKGILLLHLVLALASSATIWFTWRVHARARRRGDALPRRRVIVELLGAALIAMTGHLGGFLSGVNGPG